MAKISLRAYHKEIASLIDRGQTDEAIAHCKYILKLFPKHIDTYRLLGKAYLEAQRFSEATDIFQRVLAVVPDDFVAHVGMSIIREDEADLDAAIWHMERAFEVQPSKATVQDELKRLYGRRDGVEPPKLRLTRGALIRMYERGELFSQAISEARAALQEDSQRSDIEVILARLFFNSGQKVEATEICSRLVGKNPYIFEANRILAETLPGTTKAEDAKKYLQRAIAIDPYYAYVTANAPLINMVPDNAVVLERLDYSANEQFTSAPNWAQNVGADIQTATETVPDWLGTSESSATAEPSFAPIESPPQTSLGFEPSTVEQAAANEATPAAPADLGGGEIPDWMKQAGWTQTTPDAVQAFEAAQPPVVEPTPVFEPEVVPGEVPDWLSSMAPAGVLDTQAVPAVEERLDVLASLLPQSSSEPPAPAESILSTPPTTTPEIPAAFPETPAWLEQPVVDESQPVAEIPPAQEWVKEFSQETPETQPAQRDIPEWMKPASDETIQVARPTAADSTDWMKSLESEETPAVETPPVSKEVSEWVASAAETGPLSEKPAVSSIQTDKLGSTAIKLEVPATPPVQQVNEVYPPSQQDEAMAWLESLAAKQGAEEGTLLTKPEDRIETTPDWIAQMQTNQTSPEPTINTPSAIPPVQSAPVEDDTMAWLKSFTAEQATDSVTSTVQPATQAEPQPDWVSDQTMQPPSSAEPLPDWLAGEGFVNKPEPVLPQAEVPQWVEQPPAGENINPLEAAVQPPPTESLPDWMVTPQEPVSTPTVQPPVPQMPEVTLPDWMSSIGNVETGSIPISNMSESTPEQPAEIDQRVIQQVQPQTETPPIDLGLGVPVTEPPVVPEEDIIRLDELSEVSPIGVGSIGQQPAQQQAQDDAFAWLESLAERQGADEGTLIVPPEARKEQPPEWVAQQVIQEPAPVNDFPDAYAVENVVEPVPSEPLPNWLEPQDITPVDTTPAQAIPGADESFPDWISAIPVEGVSQVPDFDAPLVEEPIELPDWLKDAEKAEPISIDEIRNVQEPLGEILPPVSPVEEEVQPVLQPVEMVDEIPFVNETPFQVRVEEPVNMPEEIAGEKTSEEILADAETVSITRSEVMAEIAKLSQAPNAAAISASPEIRELLSSAQSALNQGNIDHAVNTYNQLIESDAFLEDVIHDLRNALYRFPVDIALWQTLGDAYVRNHNLQEALDAYTKAEEFLK